MMRRGAGGEHTAGRAWAIFGSGWLALTALYLVGFSLQPDATLPIATLRALVVCGLGAILALPLWSVAGRIVPIEGRSPGRGLTFGLLSVAGVGYAAAHALAFGILCLISGRTMEEVHRVIVWDGFGSLWLYVIVISSMIARRSSERARAEYHTAAKAEAARIAAEDHRVRADLHSLRAHLKPHLLFNTLNAVSAIVETNPQLARTLIAKTGALLRRLLEQANVPGETHTLANEWAVVADYLEFEMLRMGSRLRLHSELSSDALECGVPAYTLQPLIENAIRHGLSHRPTGGQLIVRADVRHTWLFIVVADDGIGADPQHIRLSAGSGLRSVQQRLEGIYGDNALMHVDTSPEMGFRVTLWLPAREAFASAARVMSVQSAASSA